MSNKDVFAWQERVAKEHKQFMKAYAKGHPARVGKIQNRLRLFDCQDTAQENIYGYCRAKLGGADYGSKGEGSLTSKDGVIHNHMILPVWSETSSSKNGSKNSSKRGSKASSVISSARLKQWEQDFRANSKNPDGMMDVKQFQNFVAARRLNKPASVASSRRSQLSHRSQAHSSVISKVTQDIISESGSQANSVLPKDSASQMVVSSAASATSSIAQAVEELVKREVKQHIDQYLRKMATKNSKLETIQE